MPGLVLNSVRRPTTSSHNCDSCDTIGLPGQVPVPGVAPDERLLVKPLPHAGFFRVVARYGYTDRVDQARA